MLSNLFVTCVGFLQTAILLQFSVLVHFQSCKQFWSPFHAFLIRITLCSSPFMIDVYCIDVRFHGTSQPIVFHKKHGSTFAPDPPLPRTPNCTATCGIQQQCGTAEHRLHVAENGAAASPDEAKALHAQHVFTATATGTSKAIA